MEHVDLPLRERAHQTEGGKVRNQHPLAVIGYGAALGRRERLVGGAREFGVGYSADADFLAERAGDDGGVAAGAIGSGLREGQRRRNGQTGSLYEKLAVGVQ